MPSRASVPTANVPVTVGAGARRRAPTRPSPPSDAAVSHTEPVHGHGSPTLTIIHASSLPGDSSRHRHPCRRRPPPSPASLRSLGSAPGHSPVSSPVTLAFRLSPGLLPPSTPPVSGPTSPGPSLPPSLYLLLSLTRLCSSVSPVSLSPCIPPCFCHRFSTSFSVPPHVRACVFVCSCLKKVEDEIYVHLTTSPRPGPFGVLAIVSLTLSVSPVPTSLPSPPSLRRPRPSDRLRHSVARGRGWWVCSL